MLRPAGGGQRRKARKELGGSEEDVTYVASSLSLSLYSSHPLPTARGDFAAPTNSGRLISSVSFVAITLHCSPKYT